MPSNGFCCHPESSIHLPPLYALWHSMLKCKSSVFLLLLFSTAAPWASTGYSSTATLSSITVTGASSMNSSGIKISPDLCRTCAAAHPQTTSSSSRRHQTYWTRHPPSARSFSLGLPACSDLSTMHRSSLLGLPLELLEEVIASVGHLNDIISLCVACQRTWTAGRSHLAARLISSCSWAGSRMMLAGNYADSMPRERATLRPSWRLARDPVPSLWDVYRRLCGKLGDGEKTGDGENDDAGHEYEECSGNIWEVLEARGSGCRKLKRSVGYDALSSSKPYLQRHELKAVQHVITPALFGTSKGPHGRGYGKQRRQEFI
jgi:hypothetical protein